MRFARNEMGDPKKGISKTGLQERALLRVGIFIDQWIEDPLIIDKKMIESFD